MPGNGITAGFAEDGRGKGEASSNKKMLPIDFTGGTIKRMEGVAMQPATHQRDAQPNEEKKKIRERLNLQVCCPALRAVSVPGDQAL